jgi:hypothetical protein
MVRTSVLWLWFAMLALPALPALADEPPAKVPDAAQPGPAEEVAQPDERVWSGYLWKDEQGRVRMGWPVIAMGVMAQPAHVIGSPLAEALTPLLSTVKEDWLFLNYVLEEPVAKALPQLPRILVRIRGVVKIEGGSAQALFEHDKPRVLTKGRVLGVEFLDAKWLEHWGTVYREPYSPFRIRDENRQKVEAGIPTLAPKVLEAVRAMQRRPLATPAQRALVQKLDRRAKVDGIFRKGQEYDLIRWLRRENETRTLGLVGLDDLGEVPPTGIEIQRAFLEAETRSAFLKQLRTMWSGGLGQLVLPHYAKRGGGTSWVEVDVDTVATRWTDEQYLAHRALTKKMLGS